MPSRTPQLLAFRFSISRCITLCIAALVLSAAFAETPSGGRIVVAQRSEPKTLNPVFALDEPSRSMIGVLHAPLIRIHNITHRTEAMLAESWTVSGDGREIVVRLRPNLKFSDGSPLTVDDVLFTFQLHLDAALGSPQRETLMAGGRPLSVTKLGANSIRFSLAAPYALGERMLGGVAILPRERLQSAYTSKTLPQSWSLASDPSTIVGAGPFRFKEYRPGQRVVVERNPHYYRRDEGGQPLPYLDQVEFVFGAGEDAQVARLLSGEADLAAGFGAAGFASLERSKDRSGLRVFDAGAGLDYTFLLFNLNPGAGRPAQAWMQRSEFRRAVSAALDRAGVAKLVYRGRATPVWGPVSPSRQLWFDTGLARPDRSIEQARQILRQAGFRWNNAAQLVDPAGVPVQFTIIASSSNPAYTQTAEVIQEDLKAIGITATVVPLEFRSLVDRVTQRHDFDAAIMAMRPGDSDPVADLNVLTSQGRTRLWNLSGRADAPWEGEIDRLMRLQMETPDLSKRQALFRSVQNILATEQPFVCLVSPNVLAAARTVIGNIQPASVGDTLLWNIDQLYRRGQQ